MMNNWLQTDQLTFGEIKFMGIFFASYSADSLTQSKIMEWMKAFCFFRIQSFIFCRWEKSNCNYLLPWGC